MGQELANDDFMTTHIAGTSTAPPSSSPCGILLETFPHLLTKFRRVVPTTVSFLGGELEAERGFRTLDRE
jgi:hypothetical protein